MKKLISILLTAAICASTVTVFAEHEGPTEVISQKDLSKDKIVSDIYEGGRREEQGEIFYVPGTSDVSTAAKVLMDLGIIDHYHPDSALQRNVLKKVFELCYGSADSFNEYFKGEGVEKETLTFDEALLVYMNMTGYAHFANAQGGDMNAFILAASEHDMLDGVDVEAAREKLTAKEFARLTYNAFTIDMVKTTATYHKEYYVSEGESIMTEYLKLRKAEGIVRANSYTSIMGVDGVGEGNLIIEGMTYKTDLPTNADEFLGYSVIAFINNDNVVEAIAVNEKKNSFIEFDNDDEILPSPSKQTLQYYEGNRRKTIKVDRYADLIYNHILWPGWENDFYVIKNGTLKLIDNNGDEIYDVVFRKEYTSFMPQSKSESGGTVTDRNNFVYNIKDVLDGKYMGIHAENGEKREYKDFTHTTGISVLLKKGTNLVTELVILDKHTFEGRYRTGRNAENEYVIGDKEFRMSEVYKTSCANTFPFTAGSNVLVYLDMFGTIIFAESTTTAYKYAWLMKLHYDEHDEQTVLKLFTEDDTIRLYEVTDKVKFNSSSIPEANLRGRTEIYSGGNTVPQLIKYKINGDGHINGIMTADKTSNCGFGKKKPQGNQDFQMNLDFWDQNKSLKFYKENLNSFAGKYYVDVDKTIVFGIPNATALANEGEDAYRIVSSFDANYAYKVNLYDVDHEYRVGAVAMQVTASASQWVNKGYGSNIVVESGYEYDPAIDETVGVVHAASAGGTWSANLKAKLNDFYGNQLTHTYGDYDALFKYGYPITKMLTNDPSTPVRNKIQTEYAKYVNAADMQPGTIFKYTAIDGYVAYYNIEFMILPDMPIRDHFFEFGYTTSGDDASYSDMYDAATGLPKYEYSFDSDGGNNPTYNSETGISKTKFYGGEIISFGQVTEKFVDGFVFNAHTGEADEEEWNRRIYALPTQVLRIYNHARQTTENATVAELQVGDYIFLNMIRGKIQGIVIYRDLPNA